MLKKIREKIKKRSHSGRAGSETIEFLFVILFVVQFTIALLDAGFYFNDRNIITNSAQQGARLTAIYGGSVDTPISRHYGGTNDCQNTNGTKVNGPAACEVYSSLKSSHSSLLPSTKILDVSCSVKSANSDDNRPDGTVHSLQDRPACSVTYHYQGLPGSAYSFIASRNNLTVTETSNAEVVNTNSQS